VIEITPYPGDEIKDLDREVEELHRSMDEARKKRQAESEETSTGREARKERTMRRRQRTEGSEGESEEKEAGTQSSDLLDPVEEKAKGEQVDENG
jgi:hypothetical protein